jgi:acyl-CoA dehydrogenase
MPEPTRFRLSDEELALVAEARRVGEESLEPISRAGEEGRVNRELVRALASHGFLSRLEPERPVSGGGPSALELCLVREGLAGCCA